MKRIACITILLLTPISRVQNGPTKADFILLAANTTIRSLDVYSTRKGLEQGAREVSLPQAIAGSTQIRPLGRIRGKRGHAQEQVTLMHTAKGY